MVHSFNYPYQLGNFIKKDQKEEDQKEKEGEEGGEDGFKFDKVGDMEFNSMSIKPGFLIIFQIVDLTFDF